jgi:hypothetical protein
MTPIATGKPAASSQGVKFSYNPKTGLAYGTIIRGRTDQAATVAGSIEWWIANLVAGRTAFDYEQQGPIGQITITAESATLVEGEAEIPIDSWQLFPNEVHKSWDKHPRSQAMEQDQYGNLAVIRTVAELLRSTSPFGGDDPFSYANKPDNLPPGWTFGAYSADAEAAKTLLVYGDDQYADSEMALRHTQTISDKYTYNSAHFNFDNIETVYTPAELISECGSGWAYNLPPTIAAAVASMSAPVNMDTVAYRWGWRKQAPSAVSAANSRIELSIEFVLGQWAKYYYEPKP